MRALPCDAGSLIDATWNGAARRGVREGDRRSIRMPFLFTRAITDRVQTTADRAKRDLEIALMQYEIEVFLIITLQSTCYAVGTTLRVRMLPTVFCCSFKINVRKSGVVTSWFPFGNVEMTI